VALGYTWVTSEKEFAGSTLPELRLGMSCSIDDAHLIWG
jgi:hypothetical protein